MVSHAIRFSIGLFIALSFLALCQGSSNCPAQERLWGVDADGRHFVRPWPLEPQFLNNSWTAEYEAEFQSRVDWVIRQTARDGGYGGTFFENEKRAYGWAMLSILGGYEEQGLAFLQSPDADAERWHQATEGIDFYPAFTLKHQVRKYFYFGHLLEPEYRERMKRGARRFTEIDPLGRPHPAFTGASGWGPDAKNSWVDVRDTDNLKLMRETSIYLFAEETGNTAVRDQYKELISKNIIAMYSVGMGEWDSENYMGHTVSPLVNLYDFAKDPEVKWLAKAALDRAALNLATKYWRGSYNGPSRRDYGHPYPFGGSAAMIAWLWFGGSPQAPTQFESDEAEFVTSAYRPPAAIVELAKRNFDRPLTIVSAKPDGSPWNQPADTPPRFFETQYYSRHFQFGTLRQGTQAPDINGFKILVEHAERGADTIMAAPVSDARLIASPRYSDGVLAPNSAVAQYGSLAIYLTQESDLPYRLLIPADAQVELLDHVTLIQTQKVSLALWPLNASHFEEDREATEHIQFEINRDGERIAFWPNSRILSSRRQGPGTYGFAIEVCDEAIADFKSRLSQAVIETEELPIRGAVNVTSTRGERMRLQWGNVGHAIHVWQDGREILWDSPERQAAYHTLDASLVQQDWRAEGRLTVECGGHRFECQVDPEGRVKFSEE